MLLAILSLLNTATAATVSACGGTFSILSLGLQPSNPSPGDNITLHLEYSVPPLTLITDGISQTSVSYNFFPLQPTTEPLCSNIPCPLSSGTYSNDTTTVWPTGLSGSFTSTMKWFDPDTVLLLCLKISGSVKNRIISNSRALTLWKTRRAH